jgi:hypothetical protein
MARGRVDEEAPRGGPAYLKWVGILQGITNKRSGPLA